MSRDPLSPYYVTPEERDADDWRSERDAEDIRQSAASYPEKDPVTGTAPPIVGEVLAAVAFLAGIGMIPFFFAALNDALQ